MPNVESLDVRLTDADGHSSYAKVECREWTKNDARARALRWGGSVIGIAVLMIPIPIVHFAAIPVLLIGVPTVSFAVYKMYSSGTDLRGEATCPKCQAKLDLQVSVEYWPIQRFCSACRSSYAIEQT